MDNENQDIIERFNNEERVNIIFEHNRIASENMTEEERNIYIKVLENCKDICDTENKIGNVGKGEIIKGRLRKEDDKVYFSAFVTYYDLESEIRENRCVDGIIYLDNDRLLVDMHVERLCIKDEHKTYMVLDKFYLENDRTVRESSYNYEVKDNYKNDVDIKLGGTIR